MSNSMSEPNEVDESPTFREELASLINRHSLEQHCNTPDYLIAEYLIECFNAYCNVKSENDGWHSS